MFVQKANINLPVSDHYSEEVILMSEICSQLLSNQTHCHACLCALFSVECLKYNVLFMVIFYVPTKHQALILRCGI